MNCYIRPETVPAIQACEPVTSEIEARLSGIDLNLLVALEALITHRNVTLAARTIGQSQPAMSRALARLRDVLNDDLLVRGSSGLQLTARGNHLARHLPASMARIRELFNLRQLETQVALSVDENLAPLLIPGLMHEQPQGNTPLRAGTHRTADGAIRQLETRTADFVLGGETILDAGIASRPIRRDDFVTLIAPEDATPPSSQMLLGMNHARIMQDGVDVFPQAVTALCEAGVRPDRMIALSDITAAGLTASYGRVALTLPRSIAKWLQRTVTLCSVAPPVRIRGYQVVIGWLQQELPPSHLALLDRLAAFADTTIGANISQKDRVHAENPVAAAQN